MIIMFFFFFLIVKIAILMVVAITFIDRDDDNIDDKIRYNADNDN